MKLFVTGAAGMLGHALVPGLEGAGHEVVALRHPQDAAAIPAGPPGRARAVVALDITDGTALQEAVREAKPDWVVNLAAWTDVDGCEGDPDRAFLVNADGARNAARAAAAAGAAVLTVSTDYVFGGAEAAPRREDDPPAPLGVYGRSKLAGEVAVRETHPRHVIVRTSWLYGRGGKNFVDTILARARAREPLRVVDDQRGSPTWTADLADGMLALLERAEFGTYHVTGSGDCTWREFAVAACETAGVPASVEAITTAQLGRPAPRPAYSVLDNGRFEHVTRRRMPHWRDALRRYLNP